MKKNRTDTISIPRNKMFFLFKTNRLANSFLESALFGSAALYSHSVVCDKRKVTNVELCYKINSLENQHERCIYHFIKIDLPCTDCCVQWTFRLQQTFLLICACNEIHNAILRLYNFALYLASLGVIFSLPCSSLILDTVISWLE